MCKSKYILFNAWAGWHWLLPSALCHCHAVWPLPGGQSDRRFAQGTAAVGDWTTDAPGVRRLIPVGDMPQPYATNPPTMDRTSYRSRPEPGPGPKGFTVDLLAEGLSNARKIITAPNGDLFLAESGPGRIKVFRQGKDGTISAPTFLPNTCASRSASPFIRRANPKFVYVANTDSVVRYPYQNGDLQARGAEK